LPGQQVENLGDQGSVGGAMLGMALEHSPCGMEEERQEHALGLAEIERALEGMLGRIRVAERIAGDRLEQESLDRRERQV
jgi:hypothetical protein